MTMFARFVKTFFLSKDLLDNHISLRKIKPSSASPVKEEQDQLLSRTVLKLHQ